MAIDKLSKPCGRSWWGWAHHANENCELLDLCPAIRTPSFFISTITFVYRAALCNSIVIYDEPQLVFLSQCKHRRRSLDHCRLDKRAHPPHVYKQTRENRAGAGMHGKAGACTEVCSGWLSTLLDVKKYGAYTTAIPATRKRPLATENGCRSQNKYNAVSVQRCSSFEIFFILIGPECRKLYIWKASHHSAFHLNGDDRKLADIMKMSDATLQPFSNFIVIGCLHHALAKYFGYGDLQYHLSIFI